jgi:capsular polysaccharide transport system permease protein
MLEIREPLFRADRALSPAKVRDRLARADRLFLIAVVLPTFLAVLYFGLFASDVYVSESKFVVRSPDKPAMTGLGVLLKSTGFSTSGDEVYAAQNYVQSRDALRALNRNDAVERAYGDRGISIFDRFNPLGLNGSFEDLFDYYQKRVNVQFDTASSVTTLTVRAFNADDAYRMNRQLLNLSEVLVNRLNERGRMDLVQFAEKEVRDAQIEDRNAAVALARYRNGRGVVDPEEQAKAQLEMVSKLQDELIGSRMQLLQLNQMAPDNPQIPLLKTKIAGLAREIDVQMGRVAGDQRSLSNSAVQYQRLELERQFSEKRLAAALTAFQDAQSEALRKQAYVERIVDANKPDEAAEPRRLRGILATLALGLIIWGILKLLLAGVREHHG